MMKKLKPMTLPHFAAWLAKQPKGKEYDYGSPEACCCAQYLRRVYGKEFDWVGIDYFRLMNNDRVELPRQFDDIAFGKPHTFGAAAKRAKAMLAKKD
jgi:hypothetical protein